MQNLSKIFLINYKDYADKYHVKYVKAFSGNIDMKGFPDKGEWIFKDSLND